MVFSAENLLFISSTSPASIIRHSKSKPTNSNITTTLLPKPSSPFPLSQQRAILRTNMRCSALSQSPTHPEYIPNRIPNETYVRVVDTTLRDGEQAPGASMTRLEKLAIAHQLAKLRVDVIEAGFPASSKYDLETVKLIAKEVGSRVDECGYVPVISAYCRCVRSDVDAAWESVKDATRPRLCIFISTSEIHMKYKLNKTADQVLELAKESVRYARSLGAQDITFVCEDAGSHHPPPTPLLIPRNRNARNPDPSTNHPSSFSDFVHNSSSFTVEITQISTSVSNLVAEIPRKTKIPHLRPAEYKRSRLSRNQRLDCGLYMMSFIDQLSNNRNVQGHIKDYQAMKTRKDMLVDLMNHDFSWTKEQEAYIKISQQMTSIGH